MRSHLVLIAAALVSLAVACSTSGGGGGGKGGTGGTGFTSTGGTAGNATATGGSFGCGSQTCKGSEVCVWASAGGSSNSYQCAPDPCAPAPLECACAQPVCAALSTGPMYDCFQVQDRQVWCACSNC
jgi:hypothetical protein